VSLPWSNHRACATQLQHLAPQFARVPELPHVRLAVAAKSPWMYRHVDSLGTMCALHNLKFDHIAFTQGPTSLSHYRCVMDKNIWAVTALDKTISANISEPFNAAKHLVSFKSHLYGSAYTRNYTVVPGISLLSHYVQIGPRAD